MSDPKKLLFVSHDRNTPGDYVLFGESVSKAVLGGDPTVYYLNSAKEGVHDPGVIIRTIKEHVQKYGTLKELMIDGHGMPNYIGITAPLNTEGFLYDLSKLQKELGIKIADRILFAGCRVFADLDFGDVSFYKRIAKDLKAEVVGATNIVTTHFPLPLTPGMFGHFVEFTPEGIVRRDRLNAPIMSWIDHHTDMETRKAEKSQDEMWLASELHPDSTPTVRRHNPGKERGRDDSH
jgi:hypothetical protein